MSAAGHWFITPHAIQRFRQRIAALDDAHALAAIIHGMEHPIAMRATRRRDGTPTWDFGVDGEYRFIATVVPSLDPALRPAVLTILPATRGKDKRRGMLTWERSTWRYL